LTVREPRTDDAAAIAAVMAAVAEEGTLATEPPVDVAARAQGFRGVIEGDGPSALWVLEDDGRIVGHASVWTTGAPGVLSLGIAILREARGRGGGRALLDAIIEHARAWGAHKVELEVWPDNGPAITLYSSAGFETEGLRRDHYRRQDGTLRSAVIMALLLTHSTQEAG
jgi:RimJ/RimL family protein N-acetyltransferase